MTLRPILLFFGLLSFLGAAFLWFRTPPDENTIFGPGAMTSQLTGSATSYRAPKGSEDRVRFLTDNGAEFFSDCLVLPVVCSSPGRATDTLSVTAHFLTPSVFWPISASQHGQAVVTRENSLEAYRIHVEKDGKLYRLPLALAVFFFIAAFWFGNRPAFD